MSPLLVALLAALTPGTGDLDVSGLVDPPVRAADDGVERTVLEESGTTLALVTAADRPAGRALCEWIFVAGTRYAPADPPQVVAVLTALLEQRARGLEELGAAVQVGFGPAAIAIRVDAPLDALEEVAARVGALVSEPVADTDAVAAAEAACRAAEQEARRDPLGLANLALDDLAYPDPAAPSRWRSSWPALEPRHVEAWRRLSLARGTLWLGALVRPEDAARARAVLTASVEALPAGGEIARRPPVPSFQVPETTRVFLVDRPQAPDCALVLAGAVAAEDADLVRLGWAAWTHRAGDLQGLSARVSRPGGRPGGDWRLELRVPAGEAAERLGRVVAALRSARDGSPPSLAGVRDERVAAERARLQEDPGEALHWAYSGRSASAALAALEALSERSDAEVFEAWRRAVDPGRMAIVAVGPAAGVAGGLARTGPVTRLPARGVRGDSYEAVARVERMFDALGGRARWAELSGYSLVGEVEAPGVAAPLRMALYHRFEPFALRLEQSLGAGSTAMVVREDGAWSLEATAVVPLPPDRHRALLASAERSLYGNLRRLARESTLRARTVDSERGPALEFYLKSRFHALFRVSLDPDGHIASLGFGQPGRPGSTLYLYSGWQETGGWPWPRRREDTVTGLVTRATFTPNPAFDEELFSSGKR